MCICAVIAGWLLDRALPVLAAASPDRVRHILRDTKELSSLMSVDDEIQEQPDYDVARGLWAIPTVRNERFPFKINKTTCKR